MLTPDIFYKKYGIRKLSQLVSPSIVILRELPRSSIYHHISSIDENKDLSPSLPILAEYDKKIYMDVLDVLVDPIGKPTHKSLITKVLTKPFFLENIQFKYLKDPYNSIDNDLTLLTTNSNYLDDLYRYVNTPFLEYYKFHNKYSTLWSYVNKSAIVSDRQQFIPISIPKVVPGVDILKVYKDKNVTSMLKVFIDDEMLMVLDIWRWLVEESDLSTMSVLSDNILHKVNLIIRNSEGRSVVLNLGYLRNWTKEHDILSIKASTKVTNIKLGKLFLKLLMVLQITNDELDELDDDSIKEEVLAAKEDTPEEGIDLDLDSDLDSDMKMLDVTNKALMKDRGILIDKSGDVKVEVHSKSEMVVEEVLTSKTPTDTLTAKVSSIASNGNLAPAAAKVFLKDIKTYSESLDPYTNKPIKEYSLLTTDDLTLDTEDVKIVASDLVKDKSMLQSSLLTFDKKYVNNVLNKDMVRIVSDLQNGGVVVKKHTIKTVETKLGSYDTHTLTIKPIDGMASTLKFNIPKVSEHGTMIINGKESVMRKQRVD